MGTQNKGRDHLLIDFQYTLLEKIVNNVQKTKPTSSTHLFHFHFYFFSYFTSAQRQNILSFCSLSPIPSYPYASFPTPTYPKSPYPNSLSRSSPYLSYPTLISTILLIPPNPTRLNSALPQLPLSYPTYTFS